MIRAPTSGVILEKFKEVGEIAVPGGFEGSGELIRMANLEDMRAELDVNETELARVKLGQPAEVKPDAYTDRSYAAKVVKLYPQINRQKGTLKVEVAHREARRMVAPGHERAHRVPRGREARRAGRGGGRRSCSRRTRRCAARMARSFVWVVTGGVVRRQAIETAGERGGQLVVTKGLAGGEALVTASDVDPLREGVRVQVPPARQAAP